MASTAHFATRYRALVLPRLERLIEARIADGTISFRDTYSEVMAEAARLGSGFLAPELLDDLIDWAQAAILDALVAVEEAETLVVDLMRESSREVIRQRVREFVHAR